MMIVSKAEAMNPLWRNTMEDKCVIYPASQWGAPDPNMTFVGIYDGHGGREMVDFLEYGLSYHVAQELNELIINKETITNERMIEEEQQQQQQQREENENNINKNKKCTMETCLVRAFLMADIHARSKGVLSSGAAVAICLIQHSPTNPQQIRLITANAGDCRIVLGHNGEAIRLTMDHRTNDPMEIQRIQRAGGVIVRGRVMGVLAVTRSLGDQLFKRFVIAHPYVHDHTITIPIINHPQNNNTTSNTYSDHNKTTSTDQYHDNSNNYNSLTNKNRSFLIVACDGFWDAIQDQEAVNLVQSCCMNEQGDLSKISTHLVEIALRRGTTDNVTVVVIWL